MSSDRLTLQVITHEGKQFEKEVFTFRLFTPSGELGVLPEHTTLVTSINETSVYYSDSENYEKEEEFIVAKGTLKVQNNLATILTTKISYPN
jgi:F0F1-type ATP synthase epsilon subunit